VLGLIGLDDRPSRALAPPGPPDRLDEQLVRAFGGALVGEVERDIGRDDPDQRHRRDVEALGHEARADQDVEPALGEGVDDALGRAAVLDDVAIEASDTVAREALTHLALDALRATAQIPDPWRSASGTA